jgi:hypothetical protein
MWLWIARRFGNFSATWPGLISVNVGLMVLKYGALEANHPADKPATDAAATVRLPEFDNRAS